MIRILLFLLNVFPSLFAHGFVHDTIVQGSGTVPRNIHEQILLRKSECGYVESYDVENRKLLHKHITSYAEITCNCYCEIVFYNHADDKAYNIYCMPTQEFYAPFQQKWLPAYALSDGDALLGKWGNKIVVICDVLFHNEPFKGYMIEVEDTHTFFVGKDPVLTHNMALPAIQASIGFAFGSGAVAGGSAGSFFGPVSSSIGMVLGGLVGIGIKKIFGSEKNALLDFFLVPSQFDSLEEYFGVSLENDQNLFSKNYNNNNENNNNNRDDDDPGGPNNNKNNNKNKKKNNNNKQIRISKKDDEDERIRNMNKKQKKEIEKLAKKADEYDPKKLPTKKMGFKPPKDWKGEKVFNSNLQKYGYEDFYGRFWSIDKSKHRGGHFDVSDQFGKHIANVSFDGRWL